MIRETHLTDAEMVALNAMINTNKNDILIQYQLKLCIILLMMMKL